MVLQDTIDRIAISTLIIVVTTIHYHIIEGALDTTAMGVALIAIYKFGPQLVIALGCHSALVQAGVEVFPIVHHLVVYLSTDVVDGP